MSMIVRRSSPFGELLSLREAMDRLFEDSFVRPLSLGNLLPVSSLPLDVSTTADELVVEAQLPGVAPEDVEITIEAGSLTVSGESGAEREEREGDYLVHEIRRGRVSRTLALPEGLEPEEASANFEHGVLTLRIPKAEQTRPRQIRITPVSSERAEQRIEPSRETAGSAS